jgi:bifunctional oligoribonuclease and PAP phosphatase NrnA
MHNDSFEEIFEKIKNSENILMSLHRGPDGDSLGSCCAMKYFLEKLGKKVKIISSDSLSNNLLELYFSREVEFGIDISEMNLENFDLFLSLDINKKEMLTEKEDFEFPKNISVINIDHHETNSYFGTLNYVSSRKTSTCSILLDFFENKNIEIDREIANRLLLGICTDSLFFRARHAEDALKESSKLIERGGDYNFILNNVLLKEKLELRKFFCLVINNLKEIKNKKLGYSVIAYDEIKNLNLTNSEIRLGVQEIAFIDKFDFVFTLIETKNFIKGGFRSNYGFDVSKFAEELGGGGHKSASGFFLSKMSLEEAEKKVLEVIERVGIRK